MLKLSLHLGLCRSSSTTSRPNCLVRAISSGVCSRFGSDSQHPVNATSTANEEEEEEEATAEEEEEEEEEG